MTTDANRRHPGWPEYVGPKAALCLLAHHDILCQWCHDIPGRWEKILNMKPTSEIPVRAAHFVVLEEEEIPLAVREAWKTLEKAQEVWEEAQEVWEEAREVWEEAWEKWEKALTQATPVLETLLAQHVHDHRWDGRKIVFPKAERRR